MADGKNPEKPSELTKDANNKAETLSHGLTERLSKLDAELAKKGVLKKDVDKEKGKSETSSSVAHAMKLSSEFIAGIIVGAVIGWTLDQFAGTNPWGMIVFLLLGFVAGTLNVLRSSGYVADKGGITSKNTEKERNSQADS